MPDRPVAIGPNSRTVIGSVTSETALPPRKPFDWKRYLVPAGLIGIASYIIWRGKL